ncbi:hypothetical protein Tco_1430466 [Tanacetum coccineum]
MIDNMQRNNKEHNQSYEQDPNNPWLRYHIEEYTEQIRHSYEKRLETIWNRSVNRVHVLDFEGLTAEMRQDLVVRLRMVYFGEGQQQEMAEAGFGAYWAGSDRLIPDKGDLSDYWMEISSDRDFLGPALSYVLIRDPVRRLCHRVIAYSISGRGHAPKKVTGVNIFYLRSMDRGTTNALHLLAQYLFRHAEGRKSRARLLGGHFIGRLAMHFGLVSDEGLRGLQVVAQGPERQQATAASTSEADKAGQAIEEVALEIPAPSPAPAHAPPPAPQPRTMSQRIERLEEEVHDLWRDVIGIGQTYQPFDSALVGSSGLSFRRRVRPRTGDASTSAAPHIDAQLDP